MEHQCRLFSGWHVRPTSLQYHLPLLYQVWNARPLNLDIHQSGVGAQIHSTSDLTLRNPLKSVFPSRPPISVLSWSCNVTPSSCVICVRAASVARSCGEIPTDPGPIELHGFQELLSLRRVVRIVSYTEQRSLGLDKPFSELLAVGLGRPATLQYSASPRT